MGFITRLWNGEISLFDAFWFYAIGLGLLVNLVALALLFALLVNDAPNALLMAAFLLPIPYNVLFAVGVWRSADNDSSAARWADAAKITAVLWALLLTLA